MHTFHLLLWGLHVEGNAVTGVDTKPMSRDDCERLCQLHMGFTPRETAFNNGMTKLSELRYIIESLLP